MLCDTFFLSIVILVHVFKLARSVSPHGFQHSTTNNIVSHGTDALAHGFKLAIYTTSQSYYAHVLCQATAEIDDEGDLVQEKPML